MKTRRILSVVLALMFVLSTLSFASVSVSAATPEVYVDQANGNDNAKGTQDAPVQSFGAAFTKVDDGGTVYVIGTYNFNGSHFPGTTKKLTVSGVDANSLIDTSKGAALNMNSDIAFTNINMFGVAADHYPHLNTAGYKLTLLEGFFFTGNGQAHASTVGASSAGEHFVIDGADVTKKISLGGAYITDPNKGINGDVLVEVLSGSLGSLAVSQDGYADGHKSTTIYGNVNVRVGKAGTIKAMNNTGRYSTVKGYMQMIIEEGGSMCELDLTNFVHQDVYKLVIADTANGNVNFTSEAGVFEITCKDGYVAKLESASGTTFTGAGKYYAPLGEEVKVSFTNEKTLGPAEVDVILEPATPGETEWPVAVSDAEHFSAEVLSVNPEHETVGYAIPYTYEVKLSANDKYVFPAGFAFTINGSSEYRIEVVDESYDYITFTYTLAETAKDETRAMISYVGGIGTAGTAPYNEFVDFNSTITVGEQYFTQGGYRFDGYTDGTSVYQPGDDYTVGTEDVVFTSVWTKLNKYQVVFDGNGTTGGYAPTSIENYAGMYITIPENTFANTGYVFTNWTDADGKVYKPGELVLMPESNIYLEANWEVNPVSGEKVYVDVINGLDENDGSAPEKAVATLYKAISLANGGNVTVIVIGNLSINGTLPENAGNVTITGYDSDSALMINGSVSLGAATNIENIKINAKSGAFIATNGYKAVIGPNLENVGAAYDIVDGGINTTVDAVDTTIYSGVTIGTYYLGGANLTNKAQGIAGNVSVRVSGANIDTIDFAPKGGSTATITGYMVFNVDSGKIGNFIATEAYVKNAAQPGFIFFNNGTIPEIGSDLKQKLQQGRTNTFIVDSGMGGAVEFTPNAQGQPQRNGRIQATADTTNDVWASNGGAYSKKTSYFTPNPITRTITKVRYGAAFDGDIAATIVAPTGGAEAFSITATPNDASITDVVSIQLDGWTPELVGGKFNYETQYSANVLISLADGYFFNDAALPAVILNDEAVVATVNTDGTLSASYQFPTKTGYAPQLNVYFEIGDEAVVGSAPAAEKWDHMSTDTLPYATGMSNLGYRFTGWRCDADNQLYRAGASYSLTGNTDVTFTAEWAKRGNWELPNVLILYDLSAYGRDKGRNPGFASDDEPIKLTKAFEALEHEINGKKSTVKVDFDHETQVVKIESDGKGKAFTINDYTLNRAKADTHKYPHLTIIYYYETTNAKAAGDYGHINYGNVILADGNKSNWFGQPVMSKEPVVANKWACVTWDFTEFNEAHSVPEGSVYNQFHISPIGTKSLSELAGDTLYLKAMYFSQKPAITK